MTIPALSFHQHILALHAAVEAARAGEAGMGFAAADEVSNWRNAAPKPPMKQRSKSRTPFSRRGRGLPGAAKWRSPERIRHQGPAGG